MSDPLPQALKLWVVLTRAVRAITVHAEIDAARHQLTLAEFGILEALYHKGPLLCGELQEKILVSSGGVTYLLNRLVKRGYIVRRPSPDDRRARYAQLTGDGERFVARVFPQHARTIERAMRGLSPDEQARAVTLIRRLGRSAEALERSEEL